MIEFFKRRIRGAQPPAELNEIAKIKPCPFCGKKPYVRMEEVDCECDAGEFYAVYVVKCRACRICFENRTVIKMDKHGQPTVTEDGYKRAMSRWNARAAMEEANERKN